MVHDLTPGEKSVLRVLRSEPWRVFDGREIIENIFAITAELPLDACEVSEIVRFLEQRGWVRVVQGKSQDERFDFRGVQLTGREQAGAN